MLDRFRSGIQTCLRPPTGGLNGRSTTTLPLAHGRGMTNSIDGKLIDQIYEAAVIPELWPNVLEKLAKIAKCYGGTLFSVDAQREVRSIVTEQFREIMDIFVRDGWSKKNIRAERLARLKHPGFATDRDVISAEEMDSHPYYTEFIRPNGGGWAIGTIIPIPSGDLLVFNLERRYADGPIEKNLCIRLDPLRPHLARAGLLSVRLRMERARSMADTLGQVGLPAAIVRQNGRALATNDLFKLLGKQISTGAFDIITIANASSDVLLKRSLAELQSGDTIEQVRSIPIPAVSDRPALVAHLVPIKGAARDIFSRAFTIIVVTPLEAPMAPSEDVLNGLFDLTPAEVKVAQGIVCGSTIIEVALNLKLSRETVRSQIKSVFAKTGTGRQSELVGLLARATLQRPTIDY